MKRTAGRRLGSVLVVGAILLALSCGSIENEEVTCEEAVSRLEECCPNFLTGRFLCGGSQSCSSRQTDFTEPTSTCIRERSCAELVDRGICTGLFEQAKLPSTTPEDYVRVACK